jgi:hypothetical protein
VLDVLDVLPPAPSEPDGGLWPSFTGLPRLLVGVVAWVVGAVEAVAALDFLRLFIFDARVDTPGGSPTGKPRLRCLMTSVFSEIGRTTPFSFKRPQALQSG